jgi:hypothetical protein
MIVLNRISVYFEQARLQTALYHYDSGSCSAKHAQDPVLINYNNHKLQQPLVHYSTNGSVCPTYFPLVEAIDLAELEGTGFGVVRINELVRIYDTEEVIPRK